MKNKSLRSKIFIITSVIVIIQSFVFFLSLYISKVYDKLDLEAVRILKTSADEKSNLIEKNISELIKNIESTTLEYNSFLKDLSREKNISIDNFYQNDETYEKVSEKGAEFLSNFLETNNATGAFIIFKNSKSNENDKNYHSGLYLKNGTPHEFTRNNFVLNVGPLAISKKLKIATSVDWSEDFHFDEKDMKSYNMPIKVSTDDKNKEILRYGYWSEPEDVFNDGQYLITYTLPLIDKKGNPQGVIGFEIDVQYFIQHYLRKKTSPFENGFSAMTRFKDDILNLDFFITSEPMASISITQNQKKDERYFGEFYSSYIDNRGDMYFYPVKIHMYSKNSPFKSDEWSYVDFASKKALHETSTTIKKVMSINIFITTCLSLVAIFFVTYFSTRKINSLSEYINSLSGESDMYFEKTGLLEIDNLTLALQNLDKKVKETSKTTEKILSMSLLPLGGFEISNDSKNVKLTNYIYKLLNIKSNTPISTDEWKKIYKTLISNPVENYDDIYTFDGTIKKYLRIVTTPTDSGIIGVISDVTKDINEKIKLEYEIKYDSLTKLATRNYFKKRVSEMISSSPDKIGAMLFSDLDNLKFVNDTYGHQMGDKYLIKAAEVFKNYEDYGGVVARFSGDEYAIYLHGFESKDEIRKLYKKIYKEHKNSHLTFPNGYKQKIRYSTGVSYYPFDSKEVLDLIKFADFAMYEVKHTEKGVINEFNRESYNKNSYLLDNLEELNKLFENEMIKFVFQPIVDVRTSNVFGYEALMRPENSMFNSSTEILNVAKSQSKLREIENLTFKKIFREIDKNFDKIKNKKIFINSLANQFISEKILNEISENYAHLLPNVVIEITEDENIDPELMNKKINVIKKWNAKLALDDFGSGYSNELRILSIDPDFVKIDIMLIKDIHKNNDKKSLVKNLINFCHSKDIKVLAEGVEIEEDMKTLINLDIDYIQGFYFAKPDFEFKDITEEQKREIIDVNKE